MWRILVDKAGFHADMRQHLLQLLDQVAAAVATWSPEDAGVVERRRFDLVDSWLNGFASRTITAYLGDMRHWTAWMRSQPLSESPLSPRMLSGYLSFERNRGVSLQTLGRRGASLRSLLRDLGLMTDLRNRELASLHAYCRLPRTPSRQLNPIPPDLIERLEKSIDLNCPRDVRDVALAVLLMDTMVRPSEVLGVCQNGTWTVAPVCIEDLTRSRDGSGRLAVRHIDTRRKTPPEPVYVSLRCMKWIEAWLSISGLRSGALFRTFRYRTAVRPESSPYSSERLAATLRRLGKLAGIRQRFTPSCLRASTANKMLESGMHVEDVRRAARSSHLVTVSRLQLARQEGSSNGDVLRHFEKLCQRRPTRATTTTATTQLELPGF